MGDRPVKREEETRSHREKRLAEALRANLKRRKARERQRSSAAAEDSGRGEPKAPSREPG